MTWKGANTLRARSHSDGTSVSTKPAKLRHSFYIDETFHTEKLIEIAKK